MTGALYSDLEKGKREIVDKFVKYAIENAELHALLFTSYQIYTVQAELRALGDIYEYVDEEFTKLAAIAYSVSSYERIKQGIDNPTGK